MRSENELGILLNFFRARRGAAIGFRFTDPFDNSSNGMTGEPTMLDQVIGAGDGLRTRFALAKYYGDNDGQTRRITRPRAFTIQVATNGVFHDDWTWRDGGIIEFFDAPAVGSAITAGFHFDVPVRFAEDRIEVARATFGAGDMPSVSLVEIREAA